MIDLTNAVGTSHENGITRIIYGTLDEIGAAIEDRSMRPAGADDFDKEIKHMRDLDDIKSKQQAIEDMDKATTIAELNAARRNL